MPARSRHSRAGWFLIVAAILLPGVVRVGGEIWLRSMPLTPPNQGAMVVVYLAWMASFGVGGVMLFAGGFLIVRRWRSRRGVSH